jgi:hypothetical protein
VGAGAAVGTPVALRPLINSPTGEFCHGTNLQTQTAATTTTIKNKITLGHVQQFFLLGMSEFVSFDLELCYYEAGMPPMLFRVYRMGRGINSKGERLRRRRQRRKPPVVIIVHAWLAVSSFQQSNNELVTEMSSSMNE